MSYKALGAIVNAFFVLAIGSTIVLGLDDPAAYRLITGDGEDSPPSFSETAVDQPQDAGCCNLGCCQSCCCPRWTATADVIILDRIGNKSQTILGPPTDDVIGLVNASADRLNSNDFAFGFAAGPRLSLIRQTQCYDYEVLYFGIDGWSDCRFIPQSLNPASPLLFDWSSRLYNVELNVRWNPCCQVTMLAGFRWAELREDFIGGRVLDSGFLPVGDIKTNNHLYGLQVGADARLWQRGCFSINGLGKVGIYGNHAEQISDLNIGQFIGIGSAWTNHAAFIGEFGLQARYQVTQSLALRAGYELLWLDGIAIAPAQFGNPVGIDSNATVFYHGATAGLEYSF
ncbi:MAG: BBP7 family outer membrane beta-barrel protein [Thermoguttaceae bacterium]